MLPLAGYADRLSARPGETLTFHVANATGTPVTAKVVRVINADPNPAVGGIRLEQTTVPVETVAAPMPEIVPIGSYAVLGPKGLLSDLKIATISVRLCPTRMTGRSQVVLTNSTAEITEAGLRIELDPDLKPIVAIGTQSGAALLAADTPLALGEWVTLTVSVDAATSRLSLAIEPLRRNANPQAFSATFSSPPSLDDGTRPLSLASASDTEPSQTFNGRLERPMLFGIVLGTEQLAAAWRAEILPETIAAWDFTENMQLPTVTDKGPAAAHGVLINAPTRAVRGSTWSGREHCFRHAPDQYAAIHFHDDDIDDCRWPATHRITVPEDLRSGAYALVLQAGEAEENIPFFVVPPKGEAHAPIAVLVSTYTYTVYGNHARPEWMNDPDWRAAWLAQSKAWNGYPHNPGEHRDFGLSTYNYHSDGSGIALASWRRPMLNLRIGYLTYPYPEIRASGLRHYPADSHLLAWLEAKGFAFDLITDHELHHEALDLLSRYKCVVTGTHPEYHTAAMLDALETYRDQGGNLVYLGGNGFYWKIALAPYRDGLVEIRRAEGGIRAWAAEPGEYYNQFDAEYGGLWRRNARPPQQLVGVGFTAQGNFVGSYYRIKPEVRANPDVNWILDGVEVETIGHEGFSGHGAAGFELDRADKRLGTPENAVILASSEDHPPEAPWVLVPEEQLTHITTIPGQTHKQLIHADMVYFKLPRGGQVFSTGSITFCGALPVKGGENDCARIITNVLTRFSQGPAS